MFSHTRNTGKKKPNAELVVPWATLVKKHKALGVFETTVLGMVRTKKTPLQRETDRLLSKAYRQCIEQIRSETDRLEKLSKAYRQCIERIRRIDDRTKQSRIQDEIFTVFEQVSDAEGITLEELLRRLENKGIRVSQDQLERITQCMLNDGTMWTTIDDEHFNALTT